MLFLAKRKQMTKKLFIYTSLLTGILILRDVPFINLYFIDKVWVIYLVAFLLIFLPKRFGILFYACLISLFLAFLFTMLNYIFASELLGIVVYFLMWILVCKESFKIIRSKEE